MDSPYYDHDSVWKDRRRADFPFWGPHSARLYQQLVNMANTVIKPEGAVLDLGCGAGAFGLTWQAFGNDYLGLDSSQEAILLGQERFPEVPLQVFDAATADLPENLHGTFELVTAVNSLHCLVEKSHRQLFLKNASRALPTGRGHLLLTSMCGPPRPGFKESKKPRAYLEPWLIVEEVKEALGGELCLVQVLQPTGRALIPNLYLIAAKA